MDFPVMTISIGTAGNARGRIDSHWEASKIAGETKAVAKAEARSNDAIDRRRE